MRAPEATSPRTEAAALTRAENKGRRGWDLGHAREDRPQRCLPWRKNNPLLDEAVVSRFSCYLQLKNPSNKTAVLLCVSFGESSNWSKTKTRVDGKN